MQLLYTIPIFRIYFYKIKERYGVLRFILSKSYL